MTQPIKLNEKSRTYFFPNDQTIRIENAVELTIKKSGDHRLATANDNLHIVPKGWLNIQIDDKRWTS